MKKVSLAPRFATRAVCRLSLGVSLVEGGRVVARPASQGYGINLCFCRIGKRAPEGKLIHRRTVPKNGP